MWRWALALLAGLVGVALVRRLRARAASRSGDAPGWTTCSAPSARIYELTFGWLLRGLYERMADDVAAALVGVPTPDVLEIGPGPGGLAVALARRSPGLRLTGVDVDPAMVERARARARRAGLDDRLRFETGDVGSLPFPDASFDVVTSSFSVHHWPAAATGFAEIRRVLRPGGRAIVYDLPDAWGRLETRAPPLVDAANLGGFAAAQVAPLRWPGPVSIVRRLEALRPAYAPAVTPGL